MYSMNVPDRSCTFFKVKMVINGLQTVKNSLKKGLRKVITVAEHLKQTVVQGTVVTLDPEVINGMINFSF